MSNVYYLPGSVMYVCSGNEVTYLEAEYLGFAELLDDANEAASYLLQFVPELTTFGYFAGQMAYTYDPEYGEYYPDPDVFKNKPALLRAG